MPKKRLVHCRDNDVVPIPMLVSRPPTSKGETLRPENSIFSEQTHRCCYTLSVNLARIQASCHLEEPTRPPLRHYLTPLLKRATRSLLTASLPSGQLGCWQLWSGLKWQVSRADSRSSSQYLCPQPGGVGRGAVQAGPQLGYTAAPCDLE